jgi:hypothetical protein
VACCVNLHFQETKKKEKVFLKAQASQKNLKTFSLRTLLYFLSNKNRQKVETSFLVFLERDHIKNVIA